MPEAVTVTVAKEVAEILADASLSQAGLNVERSYADWELELNDFDQLHVDVVSVMTEQAVELASRGKHQYTVPVDIGIRRKFGHEKQSDATGRIEITEIDDLVLLVQEIHELFAKGRLTEFQSAVHQETRILANPIKQMLHQNRQFTGIIRLTFRVDTEIT